MTLSSNEGSEHICCNKTNPQIFSRVSITRLYHASMNLSLLYLNLNSITCHMFESSIEITAEIPQNMVRYSQKWSSNIVEDYPNIHQSMSSKELRKSSKSSKRGCYNCGNGSSRTCSNSRLILFCSSSIIFITLYSFHIYCHIIQHLPFICYNK